MNKKSELKKTILFSCVMVVIIVGIVVLLGLLAKPYLKQRYRPWIVQYLASTITAEEKTKIYQQISKQTPSLWDTTPEPLVGRLAKPYMHTIAGRAEINTNNAGMRSSIPYHKKSTDRYRIVCLGDSFVFGEGGAEADRWCDQLQAWFESSSTLIQGKHVETIAIGLPSWTMLQEASYLTSRLSDYDPDLIIVLTVANDITDDSGVTGTGLLTNDFSNGHRQWGSGTMVNTAGAKFGAQVYSALIYDLAPTAQEYWTEGMTSLKRLAEIQKQRGGKILFSVLNETGSGTTYFENCYRQQFARASIAEPMITVTSLRTAETMLPHDSHPSRLGHALLAGEYLHAMESMGLFGDHRPALPVIDKALLSRIDEKLDLVSLQQQRLGFAGGFPERIHFLDLKTEEIAAFLGGILPEQDHPLSKPWGSVRSGFLIKPSTQGKRHFVLNIDIPDRSELFPLQIKLKLHGKIEKQFDFSRGGKATLAVNVPTELTSLPALEVMLEANHHFTLIDDHQMKVFQYIAAGWE